MESRVLNYDSPHVLNILIIHHLYASDGKWIPRLVYSLVCYSTLCSSITLVSKGHSSCESVKYVRSTLWRWRLWNTWGETTLDINCFVAFRTYNDFINYLFLVYYYDSQTHFRSTLSVFKYVLKTINWNKKREYDVNFSTRLS